MEGVCVFHVRFCDDRMLLYQDRLCLVYGLKNNVNKIDTMFTSSVLFCFNLLKERCTYEYNLPISQFIHKHYIYARNIEREYVCSILFPYTVTLIVV